MGNKSYWRCGAICICYTLAVGWIFFSSIPDVNRIPAQVLEYRMRWRALSFLGWSLTLLPLWCALLEVAKQRRMPGLRELLSRYWDCMLAGYLPAVVIHQSRQADTLLSVSFSFVVWAIAFYLCMALWLCKERMQRSRTRR